MLNLRILSLNRSMLIISKWVVQRTYITVTLNLENVDFTIVHQPTQVVQYISLASKFKVCNSIFEDNYADYSSASFHCYLVFQIEIRWNNFTKEEAGQKAGSISFLASETPILTELNFLFCRSKITIIRFDYGCPQFNKCILAYSIASTAIFGYNMAFTIINFGYFINNIEASIIWRSEGQIKVTNSLFTGSAKDEILCEREKFVNPENNTFSKPQKIEWITTHFPIETEKAKPQRVIIDDYFPSVEAAVINPMNLHGHLLNRNHIPYRRKSILESGEMRFSFSFIAVSIFFHFENSILFSRN